MCKVTSKLFLTIISILFWLIAIATVAVGATIFATYHHYDELTKGTHILVPAVIMMAVGVFIFVLGCIGCVGAFKEQKCLLGMFFTVLLIILVGIVTTCILAYVFRYQVGTKIENNLIDGIRYYNESTYQDEMDYIQKTLHCCGVGNNTDWVEYNPGLFNKTTDPYPDSCCENNNCSKSTDTGLWNVYAEGCYHKVKSNFIDHLAVIIGVTAGFAVLQLLGMISACFLFCRRTDEVPYIGLSEPGGMRV